MLVALVGELIRIGDILNASLRHFHAITSKGGSQLCTPKHCPPLSPAAARRVEPTPQQVYFDFRCVSRKKKLS
jgi:hypothetical protein